MSIRPFLIRRTRAAPTKKEKSAASQVAVRESEGKMTMGNGLASMAAMPLIYQSASSMMALKTPVEFVENSGLFGSFYQYTLPFFYSRNL